MPRMSDLRSAPSPHVPAGGGAATFAAARSARRRRAESWPGARGGGVGRDCRGDARGALPGAEGRDRGRAAA